LLCRHRRDDEPVGDVDAELIAAEPAGGVAGESGCEAELRFSSKHLLEILGLIYFFF
jgi:hypothetical protein